MTEVLIADLAQLERWKVISRTSTESYRGSKKPLRQIAQELNVDLIVEGSVTKAGDRVRVTVQLIDADLATASMRSPALAQWYAATGDLARAFEVLTRLRAIGNLPPNLAFDPLFDALRADARYAALIAAR